MTTETKTFTDTNARHDTDTVGGMATQLKDRVRGMVDSGKERVEEWKGGLQDGIRENPIRSVLIATAVGAVIGLLIGRRGR